MNCLQTLFFVTCNTILPVSRLIWKRFRWKFIDIFEDVCSLHTCFSADSFHLLCCIMPCEISGRFFRATRYYVQHTYISWNVSIDRCVELACDTCCTFSKCSVCVNFVFSVDLCFWGYFAQPSWIQNSSISLPVIAMSFSCLCLAHWGLAAGYQPHPQVVDRGTTTRYGGQLRYKRVSSPDK